VLLGIWNSTSNSPTGAATRLSGRYWSASQGRSASEQLNEIQSLEGFYSGKLTVVMEKSSPIWYKDCRLEKG